MTAIALAPANIVAAAPAPTPDETSVGTEKAPRAAIDTEAHPTPAAMSTMASTVHNPSSAPRLLRKAVQNAEKGEGVEVAMED
jgi:hypothetical protein